MRLKKNRIFIIVAVSLGIMLFGSVLAIAAGTGNPGSVDDPLVTRSYVDAKFNSLNANKADEGIKAAADQYTTWQVAELAPGQQLTGKAGTELIVRAGNTLVVDPVKSGIPDVTAGANITAGRVVSLDHLLIIPRSDGRGLNCRVKAIVMYRGEVEIK